MTRATGRRIEAAAAAAQKTARDDNVEAGTAEPVVLAVSGDTATTNDSMAIENGSTVTAEVTMPITNATSMTHCGSYDKCGRYGITEEANRRRQGSKTRGTTDERYGTDSGGK